MVQRMHLYVMVPATDVVPDPSRGGVRVVGRRRAAKVLVGHQGRRGRWVVVMGGLVVGRQVRVLVIAAVVGQGQGLASPPTSSPSREGLLRPKVRRG